MKRIVWIFGVAIAALASYAIFVLPFAFPPSNPARSSAYAAGFNNRIAELSAILLSLLVVAAALRFSRFNEPQTTHDNLPKAWLWCGLTLITAWTIWLGNAVARTQINYGEAEYFLRQIQKGIVLHLPIYRGFQFAYGPLLYWWPALCINLLGHLQVDTITAYGLSLLLMQCAGTTLCFYTVNALPLSCRLKALAFTYLVIGSISPTFGLNYSIFRFIVPLACMVLLSRQQRLSSASLAAFCIPIAGFLVSAEIGIATVAGCVALAAYRAKSAGHRWLWTVVTSILGAALFLLAIGPEYLLILRRAGLGGFDLLLTPEPRTLLLLIALIGLAPLGVVRAIQHATPQAGLLLGLYATSLALVPVALGRCDSGHEFFFGIGTILLSLVAIEGANGSWAKLWSRVWITCVVAIVLMAERAEFHLYANSLHLLREAELHPAEDKPFDETYLESMLKGHPVAIVDDVPWPIQQSLLAHHLVAPSLYCELSSVWVPEAEQRKIDDIRGADFALAPSDGMADPTDFNDGAIGRWRSLGLIYRQKRQPYVPGILIDDELKDNWKAVANLGGYTLYRRIR